MADFTNTPEFDRAAIMRAAHRYAQMYQGRDWPYAFLLKTGLRNAWTDAKSRQTPADRRVEAIEAEIDSLKYKSLRIDTTMIRRHLEAEAASIRRRIEITKQVAALSFGPIRFDTTAARASLETELATTLA